jgi:16S rRNA (cytosine967-C5)-methyltransferase
MVNAILRNLTREKPPGRPIHETTAAFAQRLGHPQWLVERWVAQYGRAAAIKICESDQAEPPAPTLFSSDSEALLPQMDDGSRLVAELAAAANPLAANLWDACAAPGGKTLILAHRLPQTKLLATDLSPRRLTAMRSRMLQYPYAQNITIEPADATEPSSALSNFDLVLADVPCSGTGTLARNPEIRLRLTPADLSRQATRQRKILKAALSRLAPGGRLLYSTCSLEPEECEQVVESILAETKSAQSLPLQPLLDHLSVSKVMQHPLTAATRGNYLRTLPGEHPGDGFFAALIERLS